MSPSRGNAPLVELIAELRWAPSPVGTQLAEGGGLGPTLITGNTNALEGFFMRFGGAVSHNLAHTETERLVPGGFPIMAHQPVYRFKHLEAGETRSLYQVGAGLFSANAVPPYESWSKFKPVIRGGVEALLASRSPEERESSFSAISLRYIDAFGPAHTEGRDVGPFISEVLGIQVAIPDALSRHQRQGAYLKPMVQLQIPMEKGLVMNVAIGEGVANSQTAIMMDTSVSTTFPVPANIDAVMEVYEQAHEAISYSFGQLVKPIEHLMPFKSQG